MTSARLTLPRTIHWSSWALAALMIAAAIFTVAWLARTGPLPFTRPAWLASAFAPDTTRHRIADGLVRDGRLIGMSGPEIALLLGDPERQHPHPGWNVTYILGPCRHGMAKGTEMLVLRLHDGAVTEARILDV